MSEAKNNQETKDPKDKLNDIVIDGRKQEKIKESHKNSKSELESNAEGRITSKKKKPDKKIQGESLIDKEKVEEKVRNESENEEKLETKEEGSGVEEKVVLTNEEIAELMKKAEERDSLLDKLLRTRAEFLNYQKRIRKEHEAISQFAIQELILDLFPEFDNFERAIKLAENSKDLDKFVEGIKLIEDQLFKVLGKYGVKSIETEGKPFDPNLHEAVTEQENDELPHHTIIAELQRGFLLKERVIRPAKVIVSKKTVKEEKPEKESDNIENDAS